MKPLNGLARLFRSSETSLPVRESSRSHRLSRRNSQLARQDETRLEGVFIERHGARPAFLLAFAPADGKCRNAALDSYDGPDQGVAVPTPHGIEGRPYLLPQNA